MKAMIFAAGLGTRLKPITDTMPKAMVPVCGTPMIEHVAVRLKRFGVEAAVVNVHHFADQIEDWVSMQEIMPMQVSDERTQLLETGGAVLHARRYLEGCGHFLIHNVDVLSNADLRWFAEQVRPESVATLMVSDRKSSRSFLFLPETMRLVGWKNNVTGEVILGDDMLKEEDCLAYPFSGIHIMSDKVFDLMDKYVLEKGLEADPVAGVRFPIVDFYLWAMKKAPIYGALSNDLRMLDVGKMDSLRQAEDMLKSLDL